MTSPQEIPAIPWSQLGPEFAVVWGRADPSDPQPEHMEILGMNGSGKTYFLMTVLQERMIVRDTPEILVVTKQHDTVFQKLGWPIVTDIKDIRKYRQCIYWPQTNRLGAGRRVFLEAKVREFLERMWQPQSNTVIAFDEIAFVEKLSPEVRELIGMYWREGRSQGITLVAMKQRPQGVQRDMSSETWWTVAFVPKDHADRERFAELFGRKQDWMPVFDQMDPENHEFLIKHTRTGAAFISWIDYPLRPVPPEEVESIERIYGRKTNGASDV